jgi:hypothetical protein
MNVDIYGDYLLNLEHNSGFKIIENFTDCDNSYQNSILFYKTVEGIYLTTDDKIKNLNISEMSESNKNDLMLASIDSLNMIEEINMNNIFSQFCEHIKFTLSNNVIKNNKIEIFTINNKKLFALNHNGLIFLPKCKEVNELKIINNGKCYVEIPVIYNLNIGGFLSHNGIILSKSKEVSCVDHKNLFYDNQTNTIVIYDSKNITVKVNKNKINLKDLFTWIKLDKFEYFNVLINSSTSNVDEKYLESIEYFKDVFDNLNNENSRPIFNTTAIENNISGFFKKIDNFFSNEYICITIIVYICITIIFILLFAYCICRLKINCLTLRKFINRSKKSKRPETNIDTIELYQKVNFENKSDDEIIGNPVNDYVC